MKSKTTVAVVFGGVSSEHQISCVTAAGVLDAIDRERYDVVPMGITEDGTWIRFDADVEKLRLRPEHAPCVQVSDGEPLAIGLAKMKPSFFLCGERGSTVTLLDHDIDVVFPLLHGPFGEDGTIQGLLETIGIPYVGSGVLASAAGMDKHYMKVVLESAGIPVGRYEVITAGSWESDPENAIARAESVGFPAFVKPCRAGSSIGISKVWSRQELAAAIVNARMHDPKVIVEAGIEGREIEVAVLQRHNGQAVRTTVPGEIVVGGGHEFYTYEAKYFDPNAAKTLFPAALPTHTVARAREIAAASFEHLGCEGLARVDMFVSGDDIVVNEINTMPGFTPISMYPMMWERSGVSYTELITELISIALERPSGLR